MTNIEEKFQQMDTRFGEKFSGLDKRLDEMNGRLTQKEQSRSAGKAGVQEEKSGEQVTSATEAGREEISQSEQQQHQGPSSSPQSEQQIHHHHQQQQQQQHQWPSSSYLSLLQHQPPQPSSQAPSLINSNGCPSRPIDQFPTIPDLRLVLTINPFRVQELGA